MLTETAESLNDAAVLATRKRILKNPVPWKTRMIQTIKGKIGATRYESIHKQLSKTKLFKKWVLHIEHKGAISKR